MLSVNNKLGINILISNQTGTIATSGFEMGFYLIISTVGAAQPTHGSNPHAVKKMF